MLDLTTYEFGYPWWISGGPLVPAAVALAFCGFVLARGWPRWLLVPGAAVVTWGAAAFLLMTLAFGLNQPVTLPTDRFLAPGPARVLDVGAGSGRAAVGVLLARPEAHVTGLDIYDGFFGVENNTPARFMRNAAIAGAAARARTVTADMRQMPFADGEFDAAVSSYAVDHLYRDSRATAVREVARVVRPGGQFLLMVVNVTWVEWLMSPHAIAHHPKADAAEWRRLLADAGFALEEEGTAPGTLYFLARKRGDAPADGATAAGGRSARQSGT